MRLRQRRFAGLCLDHGDGVAGGEIGQRLFGARMDHAAAADDDGRLGRLDQIDRAGQFVRVGGGAADVPGARGKERLGPIIRLGLHVLAEGQADRAAFGRVGHHAHRAGQCRQQMFRPGDAVEIPHDRAKAVVRADRAVAKPFDLLQDRVGPSAGKDVARDEQDGQTVHMGQRGGGDHVGRPRPYAGGHRLRPPAPVALGKGDRGMRHGLFVLPAPSRQRVADAVQRLPQPRHVAVPEDRPDPVDETVTVIGPLHRQPADHRLCGRQADRRVHVLPRHGFAPSARARSQTAHSAP